MTLQKNRPSGSTTHWDDVVASLVPWVSPMLTPVVGEVPVGATSLSELLPGVGAFADPRTLQVGDTAIRARRFVIATGARPVQPDIPGLLSVPYFTTETIFDNTRKLTHLVIIGAGPMGLELALAHRRLGCDVTVVEPGKALPQADPELAEIALRRLRDEGVTLLDESAIVAIQARSQGIGVVIRNKDEPGTLDAMDGSAARVSRS